MELKDVKWNEQAREKILLDADRALQEAVREASSSLADADKDEVYKFLFEQLRTSSSISSPDRTSPVTRRR